MYKSAAMKLYISVICLHRGSKIRAGNFLRQKRQWVLGRELVILVEPTNPAYRRRRAKPVPASGYDGVACSDLFDSG